ncbi:MAG: hypothetical protein AB1762_09010 [Gemmatimonadota bacterium]
MTNIFKAPEKHERKKRLFQIGIETLQKQGWSVTREKGLGKSSVRRITKNGESKLVSIRTSQDQWIAFPPNPKGKGWVTLDVVDAVVAVSVDANVPPRDALVHWLPADDMRKRFDRALKARKDAKRVRPDRRVWLPLYERESNHSDNVSYVGGGAGLDYPPVAQVRMNDGGAMRATVGDAAPSLDAGPMTIAQAKRGLALTFGVPESSIRINVEA